MAKGFNYYQAPGTQFDGSGLARAGELYAGAGADIGASIRDAAKMILSSKIAAKDRQSRERMAAADRTSMVFRDMMGEMGANQRSNAGIRAANQRNVDDNAALGERAAATEQAIAGRQEAARRAAQLAEEQAAEQERQNASGALKMFEAMGSDPKASPTQETDFRDVDLDHSLGSVYVQGGERGLIAHFKAKGMEDAEAGQAAKAALKPMRQPFVDPARLRRFEQLATERYGEKAAQHVVKQIRDTGPGTLDEVRERLVGERASSRSQQFGGKSGGDKPKLIFPDGDSVEDKWGLSGGGDYGSMSREQRAALFAMGSASAQKDKRWPTIESVVTQAMMSGVPPEQLKQVVAEIPQQQMLLSVEHGNRIAELNGWKAGEQAPTAQAQDDGLRAATGEQILQQEIESGKITTDAELEARAKALGVKLK